MPEASLWQKYIVIPRSSLATELDRIPAPDRSAAQYRSNSLVYRCPHGDLLNYIRALVPSFLDIPL